MTFPYTVLYRIYTVYIQYNRIQTVYTVYMEIWISSELIHSGVILQLLKS